MTTRPCIHYVPQDAVTARLPPASPWRLLVVSTQAGVDLVWQQRLDQVAPHVYRVRQVETREDLESALWEGAQFQQFWAACLIDTACPTLQEAPRAWYTWLACLTRPVALLDASLSREEQFHALLELGFHALLPAWALGGYLHFLLSLLLRPEPERLAGADLQPGQDERGEQQCPDCAALLPATAQFCGACGTALPARGASLPCVLASPAHPPVEPVSSALRVGTSAGPEASAGILGQQQMTWGEPCPQLVNE